MTLNGVMADVLRYFTDFGKPALQTCNTTASISGRIYASLLYFVVRVRCRRKESSRSLSHLLMSFLFVFHSFLHSAAYFTANFPNKGTKSIDLLEIYRSISMVLGYATLVR